MQGLIAWGGLLGAWLLVAGPVYQASVELNDEELDRDDVAAVATGLPLPSRVSPWWWLLPPVAYLLHRRRSRAVRRLVAPYLSHDQVAGVVHYISKATGWIYVAVGGTVITRRRRSDRQEAAVRSTMPHSCHGRGGSRTDMRGG